MEALCGGGFVHADLAARNVLVQSLNPVHVKVGDFGMTKTETVYYGQSTLIPYRWCSPEIFTRGKWTEKSDVWSFGVTLWELYSQGDIPYGLAMEKADVEESVCSGGHPIRLSAEACPEYMWEVMMSCWAMEEDDRPTFGQLRERLEAHLGAVTVGWGARVPSEEG